MLNLYIEAEERNIAVRHDILFSFRPEKALFLCSRHAAAFLQVFKGNDLGTNKAALKVAVNLASSLGSFGSFFDGPGPALVRAACEEGDQPEKVIGALDHAVKPRFGKAHLLQEKLTVFLVQFCHLFLHLGTDRKHLCPLRSGNFRNSLIIGVGDRKRQ